MRLAFVLLSATFGMHQYTADLAATAQAAGYEVHLVTTRAYVADRYAPSIPVHTPLATRSTGFGREGAATGQLAALLRTLKDLKPDIVHITGVHVWNLVLVPWLRRRGVRVIHTLHDLEPHAGVRFGGMIHVWNRLLAWERPELLVHGRMYADRLVGWGVPRARVTHLPLLHGFLSHAATQRLADDPPEPVVEPWALFFGRLEAYKGIGTLLHAGTLAQERLPRPWLTVAGAGHLHEHWPHGPTPGVEQRAGLVEDAAATELFRRCGVVTLPYTSATQSALVGAAYAFGKPVIVSDSGALPEYVEAGVTGWVARRGDAHALADALHAALSDAVRLRAMGQAGRAWYVRERAAAESGLLRLYGGGGDDDD